MSNDRVANVLRWLIIENIIVCIATACTFIFAPNWWKLCGFVVLMLVNTSVNVKALKEE